MKKILILIGFGSCLMGFAQDPEAFIANASALASEKNYETALQVVDQGLTDFPENHELQVYRARIFLWQRSYDSAKNQIDELIYRFPDDYAAQQLLTTLYWWSEDWESLLWSTEHALMLYREDKDLRRKRMIALMSLESYKEASQFYKSTNGDPVLEDLAYELMLKYNRKVGVDASYSQFNEVFTPWTIGEAHYTQTSKNSWRLGVKQGRMFDENGSSIGAEFYPKFSKNLYATIVASGSPSSIFPNYMAGAELTGIIGQTELAAGGRRIKFKDADVPVDVLSLGLNHYHRQYLVGYKAYFAQLVNTNTLTHTVQLRKFFKNKYHFAQLMLTKGATPLQVNSLNELSRIQAEAFVLTYQTLVARRNILILSGGGQREQYLESNQRVRLTGTIGWSRIF